MSYRSSPDKEFLVLLLFFSGRNCAALMEAYGSPANTRQQEVAGHLTRGWKTRRYLSLYCLVWSQLFVFSVVYRTGCWCYWGVCIYEYWGQNVRWSRNYETFLTPDWGKQVRKSDCTNSFEKNNIWLGFFRFSLLCSRSPNSTQSTWWPMGNVIFQTLQLGCASLF